MGVYPEFDTILDGEDSAKLLEVRRSIRSILPLVCMFIGSLVAVIIICAWLEDGTTLENIPFLRHISPRWLGLTPLAFLLEILRRQLDDLYVFSDSRVEHFNGRLSLQYSVPTIKYVDIRSVKVLQSIWGRIFGYGNIEIGTAAQTDSELILEGVHQPVELADIIQKFRLNAENLGERSQAGE